jgi:hypothetical protein
VRSDSHSYEPQPCTRCGCSFEATKWQRHIKATTCLPCTRAIATSHLSAAARARAGVDPVDRERGLGADLADLLRHVWR